MDNENMTTPTEFFFLGFPGLGGFKTLLFSLVLLAYALTVFLDITIIILVSITNVLHTPMYFFLKNFLFSEMFLVTLIVPNMLRVIWLEGASIPVTGCIIQSYLYVASGSSEIYLLAAMSYDRFVAICKPLHYHAIMNLRLQFFLVVFCWMLGFLLTLITLTFLVKLKFCVHIVIDHYLCDLGPLANLACSGSSALQIEIFVLTFPMCVVPFVLVLGSYVSIFVVIFRIPSATGRQKAFSTCSTHLTVVGMFYGTVIINYFIPVKEDSTVINKILSVIYIVITPLFNPIIYSLRNKDIRVVIYSYIHLQKMKSEY